MATFDVHFEGLPIDQILGGRSLTFGDYTRPVGIKGVQKMVNRFIKCMLTPLGSDLSDPEYGTALAASLIGNIDSSTLYSLATRAVATAEQKIRSYDSEYDIPDDERLASVEIDNIAIDREAPGVVIYLLLRNAAGTTVAAQLSQVVE